MFTQWRLAALGGDAPAPGPGRGRDAWPSYHRCHPSRVMAKPAAVSGENQSVGNHAAKWCTAYCGSLVW